MHLLTLTAGNWISIFVPIGILFLGAMGTIIYRQGGLDTLVTGMDKKMDKLDEKFDKYLLREVSRSSSPLELNETGKKIFNREEIQNFVSINLDDIIVSVRSYTLHSAYQAQEILFDVVEQYKKGAYRTILENAAFESAQHIDILMKIIALGIREQVFKELKFEIEEIDDDDPSKKKKSK